MVGDVDQLPSVGPGRVLADLIDSRRVPIIRLEEVYRQASRSLIVANAHRIRQGEMPQLETDRSVDFYFIERHRPEEILETIEHLVSTRIPRRFGLDPLMDIQLLAPMRRGQVGVEQMNLRLQQLLAADSPPVEITGRRFRQRDRVMQIRNNYDLEVFNGDIGHIVGSSEDNESLLVDFYGRLVRYPIPDIDQLVLAYACSIHKSQGSEYPCVVIPLHSQHHIMLQRNLLYTAITRGRQLVIVVGEPKALARAVRNDRQQVRFTGLAERLAGP
jgi:exodeoxyribonuclease V alpha subunit